MSVAGDYTAPGGSAVLVAGDVSAVGGDAILVAGDVTVDGGACACCGGAHEIGVPCCPDTSWPTTIYLTLTDVASGAPACIFGVPIPLTVVLPVGTPIVWEVIDWSCGGYYVFARLSACQCFPDMPDLSVFVNTFPAADPPLYPIPPNGDVAYGGGCLLVGSGCVRPLNLSRHIIDALNFVADALITE